MRFQRFFNCGRVNRLAPFLIYRNRNSAAALHVLDHATTKYAVHADDRFVAALQEISEHRFHARRTWSRYWQGQLVLGHKRGLQETLELVHHRRERRIHMPYCRPS